MTQPLVFISYSHKDENEKEELLSHLGVLGNAGLINVWSDDRIGAGANWEAEINQAIAKARVAILLVSANFLTSNFILQKEVPELLKRRAEEGLVVFPVIARSCAWRKISWLVEMQVKPKNGEPVWRDKGTHVDKDLTTIAEEVSDIIEKVGQDTSLKPGPKPIDIRIVVIAMTLEEVNKLNSRAIFDHKTTPEEREDWINLEKALKKQCGDFTSCYQENRDAWRPLIAEASIQEIAENVVATLNQKQREFIFKPEYLSHKFFSNDVGERWTTREELKAYGGILIIDALSMYHPHLRKALVDSRLLSTNRIAMVVISPLKLGNLSVNKLLENQIYTRHMDMEFTRYFVEQLYPFYEFGVGNVHNLRRWLYTSLLNIDKVGLRLEEARDRIREERGQSQGLGSIIIGSKQ